MDDDVLNAEHQTIGKFEQILECMDIVDYAKKEVTSKECCSTCKCVLVTDESGVCMD